MIANTAGVILAGGQSSRFGSNKALALVDGKPMISHAMEVFENLFPEHLLITNSPEEYSFTGWETSPDVYPGAGPLAGIHAALIRVKCEKIFVVGCDMPFVNPAVIQFICDQDDGHDIIIPETKHGLEPLHSLYNKTCLETIACNLQAEQHRIYQFIKEMQTRIIPWQDIASLDPDQASFGNINHQHDLKKVMP